jgi:hypothetical protein
MIIAICTTAEKGHKRTYSTARASSKKTVQPCAHIPEGDNSPYTLCGERIHHRAEIEEGDESMRGCKLCSSRLASIQRKQPQRIAGLLGNFRLSAPNM